MRHFSAAILIILLSGIAVVSCIDAPSFDDAPFISNARLILGTNPVNPSDTNSFVTLVFDFTDGDGDLGRAEGDTTSTNLFLENSQLDTTFVNSTFSIPYIPPIGGVPDISGTINVQLNLSTIQGFCFAKPDLTQLEYRLWVKDRGNRVSNTIVVPPIPLQCN